MDDTKQLLQTIDNRIRKVLKEQNSVNKYVGIVVKRVGDDWADVRIAGNETVFTFPNQTLNYLNEGDSVYVEVINNDMNTGIITQRFSNLTYEEFVAGQTQHTIQRCVFPVGYIVFTIDKEDPSRYYGGVWSNIAEGTFLMAASLEESSVTGYAPAYPLESRGGEAEHILTVEELPSHAHSIYSGYSDAELDTDAYRYQHWGANNRGWHDGIRGTSEVGNNKPHNNLPPYLAVYMWKRIR